MWRAERPGEDGGVDGSQRGVQRKGEDGGISQGSRGDKARRKAEEKRQARLEREQLEAEERRQREEVARLVEERRRLRDEKLEAEKESEREAAAERERELRREREAERRRQEKVKEREKEMVKEKSRETDSEDSKKKKEKKDSDKKLDCDRRGEIEKRSNIMQNGDLKRALKLPRGCVVDPGFKALDTGVKIGCGKVGSTRHIGPIKGSSSVPSKTGIAHQNNMSFWGKGLTGGLNPGGKTAKGLMIAGVTPVTAGDVSLGVGNEKQIENSCSAWNRMPWTKVWSKSNIPTSQGNVTPPAEVLNVNELRNITNEKGGQPLVSDSSGSGVSDLSQSMVEVGQPVTGHTQAKSQQCLFPNTHAVSSAAPSDIDRPQDHWQPEQIQSTPHVIGSVSFDKEGALFLGHGPQGSPVSKINAVISGGLPVQLPALSFVPLSPAPVITDVIPSVYASVHGTNTITTIALPPPVPSPIGKSVQMPLQSSVSGPPHVPAPIQLPVPIASQNQSHVPQDQLPQILEPWGQPQLSLNDSTNISAGDKWEMWDSPRLDSIQLSNLVEPLNTWNYLNNDFLDPQKDSVRPLSGLEPENRLPASLFSPVQNVNPGGTSGDLLGALPVCSSQSLWSDQSAFESAMRIWDDSDSHQRIPPEFVDCITQEVMKDPVITADGHSYERSAIERWLRTHDTSPITGEVLPSLPEGHGSGVDKTLRPNHILRGQIIEYRESMARLVRGSVLESNRQNGWSMSLGLGVSTWSTEKPHIGGFYTTPGALSVWSYSGSQNPQL